MKSEPSSASHDKLVAAAGQSGARYVESLRRTAVTDRQRSIAAAVEKEILDKPFHFGYTDKDAPKSDR